jgi:hypothetical protein
MDRAYSPINSILEQAANIVGRKNEATGEIEQSEDLKGEQIADLKSFATKQNLWVSLSEFNVKLLSKGGENEVYAGDLDYVLKLNNFEYAGDDLENFFIRIAAHNDIFMNVPYDLIGFAYNSQEEFCAVISQPYIIAEREATEEEIASYMNMLGFTMDCYDEFHNDKYIVFDAVPNNVLYGIDGDLYFIDTQINLREE